MPSLTTFTTLALTISFTQGYVILPSRNPNGWTTSTTPLSSSPQNDDYYNNENNPNFYNNNQNQDNPNDYDSQQYSNENEGSESSGLITDNFAEQMQGVSTGGYPTAPMDYLAAARQRAAERRESQNYSYDEDWKSLAEEKDQMGEGQGDGWEESLVDEGNEENLIILPGNLESVGGNDDGEEEEPQILLF